jgi:hypothetical protein
MFITRAFARTMAVAAIILVIAIPATTAAQAKQVTAATFQLSNATVGGTLQLDGTTHNGDGSTTYSYTALGINKVATRGLNYMVDANEASAGRALAASNANRTSVRTPLVGGTIRSKNLPHNMWEVDERGAMGCRTSLGATYRSSATVVTAMSYNPSDCKWEAQYVRAISAALAKRA